jgi:adenylate cyclase
MSMAARLEFSTATDPGAVRETNADWLVCREPAGPLERVQKGTTWVIADGLGGGDQGRRAAKLAAQAATDAYWDSAIPDPPSKLRAAIERTNTLLWAQNDPGDSGVPFGATVLAACIIEQQLLFAHVGRSRAYLYRNGKLTQLTEDHSWVAQAIRDGIISPEEEHTHPRRNVITRCLGIGDRVQIDLGNEQLQPGDIVLLASDGLARSIENGTVQLILERYGADAAGVLVEEAKRLGAPDNVTVATIAISASPDQETDQADRIALLSRLGYELTRSPNLEVTLASVLERVLTLSGGERAAIMLLEPDGSLATRVVRSIHGDVQSFAPSLSVAERALTEQRPIQLANAMDDERFSTSESIVAMALRSVLCVPMIVHDQSIGALYIDSTSGTVSFSQTDLDLLVSFGGHAAAALQNARLHDELVARMRDVERERRNKDVLIRSLSSALVAIDSQGIVTEWNPRATEILGVDQQVALGSRLFDLVPPTIASWLRGLAAQAEAGTQTVLFSNEWRGELGSREQVVLAGRVGRIRDPDAQISGYVFVLNDRTDVVLVEEARRRELEERERLRDLFSRYFAPSVVERLLHTPGAVELGGTRHNIAVLFADVRSFTTFSEQNTPEEIVRVLNSYLELATTEIFGQLGTIDKFLGDGVMAIFGAPVDLPDRELAAVRAAVAMSSRIAELRAETGSQVGFGIGVHTGEAIVGNIGTSRLMSYTAIGDAVNVAARLESEARTGEILISGETYEKIAAHVDVEELGSIYLKGRLNPIRVFKVLRLVDQ